MRVTLPPIVVAFLLGAPTLAFAAKPKAQDEWTVRVVAIVDGDTLTVLGDDSKTQITIRLAGIDAPETDQAFGTKAREHLAKKVFRKNVRVEVVEVDRYYRKVVGRIYLGKRFIRAEMVRDGFAWRYPQYDKPGEFIVPENDAREHGRGLWADAHPVPPWEWRLAKQWYASKAR
jgi:endonuclease YncB( thermonuclease family)